MVVHAAKLHKVTQGQVTAGSTGVLLACSTHYWQGLASLKQVEEVEEQVEVCEDDTTACNKLQPALPPGSGPQDHPATAKCRY